MKNVNEKVKARLIKVGNNPAEVEKLLKENWSAAVRIYKLNDPGRIVTASTIRIVAEFISTAHASFYNGK